MKFSELNFFSGDKTKSNGSSKFVIPVIKIECSCINVVKFLNCQVKDFETEYPSS